tara:strand:+ start:48152 stop:49009 length:858 start_codon:yes stop_codon:yes gene_type:complete
MSVNKFKLRLVDFENDDKLKIPLSLDFNSVDQAEIVNREFISVETEKAINPIVDYEKVRFTPIFNRLSNGPIALVGDIRFKLNFLINDTYPSTTHYSDIGFVDEDIQFRKNRFLNSFLRLSFYDSDIPTNQNLVSFITIYSKVTPEDIIEFTDDSGNVRVGSGLPLTATDFIVRYRLNNPITNPEGVAEGFYIYHFKSEINSDIPTALYMKAEFNNAATGKSTKFITTNELLDINSVIKKLHVRYLLTRDATGYYYTIDKTYNNASNITESSTGVDLNLYEIRVN